MANLQEVDLLELKLLLSPYISKQDCAVVMRLAQTAREAIGAPVRSPEKAAALSRSAERLIDRRTEHRIGA